MKSWNAYLLSTLTYRLVVYVSCGAPGPCWLGQTVKISFKWPNATATLKVGTRPDTTNHRVVASLVIIHVCGIPLWKHPQRAHFPPLGNSGWNVRFWEAADKPLVITSLQVAALIKKKIYPKPTTALSVPSNLKRGRQVPIFLNIQLIKVCALLVGLY